LVLRIEDLDEARCRSEFSVASIEDLKWFGLQWDEGPDIGGPFGSYEQSRRRDLYLGAWKKLRDGGFIYPCRCSRRDIEGAALAPHDETDEPIYPGTCRPKVVTAVVSTAEPKTLPPGTAAATTSGINWRFRVPEGEGMRFDDGRLGRQRAVAGRDFGDFLVWRKDDVPSYQLAVVVDDASMRISEVVRGEDLLISTFRQLLIYRALNWKAPEFYHAPLIRDEQDRRLAKRDAVLSLRELRGQGVKPEAIRERYLRGTGFQPLSHRQDADATGGD
jgi:glutamyl-tRNA synthetase